MDIRSYVAAVPEMERFYTVDELWNQIERLAEAHPETATVRRVGTSKLGEPMKMISIGTGSKNALLFACPHPNEPIGSNLLHYLSELLCSDTALRDAYDYTWHLIPCVDPDGTRLNEGWFAGPFSPRNYAKHFYRPSSPQQVEWTFPISYKQLFFDRTLPETQMLMRVIDELQPEFMVSLHNGGFCGVYYYITGEAEGLYPALQEIPGWEEMPLDLGEPEVPWAVELAPATFRMIRTQESYDYLESNGGDVSEMDSGDSSAGYAEKYGTFGLVVELAYFDDPRVMDTSMSDVNRKDAFLQSLDLSQEGSDFLTAQIAAVKDQLKGDSPFQTSVEWWAKLSKNNPARRNWAENNPDMNRPGTVAEVFSSTVVSQFYRLLSIGMLVRMLEGEIAIGNGTPAIRTALKESQGTFDAWATKLEDALNYRVVPIRKLVAVQLGAVLAAGEWLSAKRADAALVSAGA